MRPIVKPLASRHHAEVARLTEQACARWADLPALEAAMASQLSRDELASLAFAFGRQVLALGGWGWWSVSPDGRLSPGLVAWNKSWFLVPVDCVLALYAARGSPGAALARVRALPLDALGALQPFAA